MIWICNPLNLILHGLFLVGWFEPIPPPPRGIYNARMLIFFLPNILNADFSSPFFLYLFEWSRRPAGSTDMKHQRQVRCKGVTELLKNSKQNC